MLDNWNATNIFVALLIAWAGYQAILFVGMLVRLLRVPVWPVRMAGDGGDGDALAPDQAALVGELRGLGFEAVWHGAQLAGPRRWPALLLRHADGVTWASVGFQAGSLAGYPVVFSSLDGEGQIWSTTNRLGWFTQAVYADPRQADAYADDLSRHLDAHRARTAQFAPCDSATAMRRILESVGQGFGRMLAAGSLRAGSGDDAPAHLTLAAAARGAFAFMRVRRRLVRPYTCAATGGAHRRAFFVACFLESEAQEAAQPPRGNLKAGLLVISMASALLLWAWMFDWRQAVALVAILLIHECGHAIAMRAFGWKDLTMFFVPFVGALVTGRPRETAAWQQAVVLLAGPLPGLAAGLGLLLALPPGETGWRMVATMAALINLFNLLPITPLDGGRLVESALFARWPKARIAFFAASIAAFFGLALWLESKAVLVIALFLAIGLPHQMRIARLQTALRPALDHDEQVGRLYDAATAHLRPPARLPALPALVMMVKNALTLGKMRVPTLRESVAIVAVLAGTWAGSLHVLAQSGFSFGRPQVSDSRSAAQRDFDRAWQAEEYGEAADAQGGRHLLDAARALDAGDPRHVDLQVWQARDLDLPGRRRHLETLLVAGRDGLNWKRADVLREYLAEETAATRALPPAQRIERLRDAIGWAEHAAPEMLAPTLATRLRLAEAIDDDGKPDAARAMLAELRTRAAAADDCRCELTQVIRAEAWFHLHHRQPRQAMAVLEGSPMANELGQPAGRLAMDYGWALLLAGEPARALEQMRVAVRHRKPPRDDPEGLLHPLELAHMLDANGQREAARALLQRLRSWECDYYRQVSADDAEPWEGRRAAALAAAARALCAPQARAAAP